MSSILYGIEIEGFGRVANLPKATRLSTARYSTAAAEYYDVLHELPRSVRTDVDLFAGTVTMGALTIQASRLDETSVNGIGKELLRNLIMAGPRNRDLSLASDFLASTTTLFFVNVLAGGTVPILDSIVRFGRESMRVTAISGSGASRQLTVERGVFGTTATIHDKRDPFGYVDKTPTPTDRRVTLYEIDLLTGTESVIWRGVIDELPRPTDGAVLIAAPVSDQLAMLSDQRLGVARYRGRVRLLQTGETESTRRLTAISVDDDAPEHLPSPFLPDADWTPDGVTKHMPVKLGDAAVAVMASEPTLSPRLPWTYVHRVFSGNVRVLTSKDPEADHKGKEYEIFELLVGSKASGASFFRNAAGAFTEHPADMIRCLLTSSGSARWTAALGHIVGSNGAYDWLPLYWGGNIPDDQIDHPAFDTLVDDFPTSGLAAANFYLGEDEKSLPTLWETCAHLAITMGAYLIVTHDAKFSIRRIGAPLPSGVDATLTDDDIVLSRGEGLRVESSPWDVRPLSSVELEIGQDGPGGEPRQVFTGADFLDFMGSRYRYSAKNERIRETRVLGPQSTGRLAGLAVEDLAEVFRARWHMTQQPPPVYDLELVEDAPRVVAGYWVEMTLSGLFELDYSRGVTDHLGLVLSADYDLTTRTQRVRILDWSALIGIVKPISPSWRVASVFDEVDFTLDESYFSGKTGAGSDPTFWQNGSSYLLNLYTLTGVLRSVDGPQWGTIAGEDVTMNAQWADGGVKVVPEVGDIVRIADYDDKGAWDHCWLSDSDATLGAAPDPATNWST
jgi:hypothetical protein